MIRRERLPAFERLLWRACRGNVFLRTSEIDDVLNDTITVRLNFCDILDAHQRAIRLGRTGQQDGIHHLLPRWSAENQSEEDLWGVGLAYRVLPHLHHFHTNVSSFRATLYPCPDTPQERREMSIGVMTRIEDLKTVLGQTQDHRHRVLVRAFHTFLTWCCLMRNSGCCLEERPHVADQSAENQIDLPHAQPIQHRRNPRKRFAILVLSCHSCESIRAHWFTNYISGSKCVR